MTHQSVYQQIWEIVLTQIDVNRKHTLLKGVEKSGQTGLILSSKKIIGSLGTASIWDTILFQNTDNYEI